MRNEDDTHSLLLPTLSEPVLKVHPQREGNVYHRKNASNQLTVGSGVHIYSTVTSDEQTGLAKK